MRLEDLARLDLNRLVVLAVILEEGGVSRAARRLGRTQSAVSHTLAELRRDLGDELLVRAGGGLSPTPFAQALHDQLGDTLAGLGALTRPDSYDPQTAVRTFRVLWSDYLQLIIGRVWFPALRQAAPGVDVETYATTSGGPADALANGTTDLAFDVGLTPVVNLRSRLLFEDELVTMVGSQVPLNGPLDLDTFAAMPHVLVTPQGGPGGPVDRALAAVGLRRRVAVRLAHFLGVVDIVRDSAMVTTLPRRLLEALGAPPSLLHTPPVAVPPLRIRAVWHPRVQGDAGVAWLRQSLVESTGGLMRSPLHGEWRALSQ
ncbi:MAG: hypothetical protein RL071_1842 [Pseudomonadota bacterium]|jgi:DNA-binding transcriptional LysR family regulator